jgi:hypothetical protein
MEVIKEVVCNVETEEKEVKGRLGRERRRDDNDDERKNVCV